MIFESRTQKIFCADLRIDGIDRYSDMGRPRFRRSRRGSRRSQPIGGKAQKNMRKFLPQEAHRPEGFLGVCKRVSRAGDSGDRYPRLALQDFFHVPGGLHRGKYRACHPRPALVDTVIFAVAIVASDVALRRNGQMNAAVESLASALKQGWRLKSSAMFISVSFLIRSCVQAGCLREGVKPSPTNEPGSFVVSRRIPVRSCTQRSITCMHSPPVNLFDYPLKGRSRCGREAIGSLCSLREGFSALRIGRGWETPHGPGECRASWQACNPCCAR